ncbi:DNA methyltransferase [Marinobacter phage AS1]|nr:DNA methyltransferase [Marinobacter phage AS1]
MSVRREKQSLSTKDQWRKNFEKLSGKKALPRDLTPLRYPGGKGSLKYFLANVVLENDLVGKQMIEPFCGGAGASIPLLEAGLINRLHLNDANPAIAAFWISLTTDTDALISLIQTTPVTIDQWHRWKEVVKHDDQASQLELGFAAFFLNRCNRSGLLSGGPIGGLDQRGNYKIDCRFNKPELVSRVETIAKHQDKIKVTCFDACELLQQLSPNIGSDSLIFLDPPYVSQGKNLYKEHCFSEEDHRRLADFIKDKNWRWLITYDDHELIHRLYAERARGVIELSYQMQQAKLGRELLVASTHCRLPESDCGLAEKRSAVESEDSIQQHASAL